MTPKQLAIYGAGGFGRETAEWARQSGIENMVFVVDDEFFETDRIENLHVLKRSRINVREFQFLIAVGNPRVKESIIRRLGNSPDFAVLIHPTAIIAESATIALGSIICPRVVVSVNVTIENHVHLNPGSWVGHDSVIGKFSTICPLVSISGNCQIGDGTFIGTNSSIRERIKVSNEVYIGMGSVVVKDLTTGVYIGNPARRKI